MALAAQGLRVGVLDADIYGPSLPIMLGQTQHPQPAMAHGLLQPIEAHGLKAMSIGWLVGADSAVVWRGSMVTKALRQMLFGTAWGTAESPLDILLIDTPPGTGDIHLTLAQSTPLSGALIATTPQAVAATDAAKAIQMFRNLQVPVLGLVENMAGFEAPDGTIHQIFGEGQTDQLATTYHTPILARIPLHPALREAADNGTPLSAFSQTHPSLQEGFATLARHTARQLGLSPSKAHAA
jgi:ATP-binding protein involved in chromosome partitioning